VNARSRTNWAGNIAFQAPEFHRPASLAKLQALVARTARIRVLATGHSFNDMADSPGAQVSLAGLPPEVEIDSAASVARVAAGLNYAQLAGRLDQHGFALRNLASLPHISVAGACATATHGSGTANQNLAAAVVGLTVVTADGDVVEFARGDDEFDGAVVHLGALGVVTSLLLELVPSFDVAQWVYEDLPLEVLDDHFADVAAAGYSVSMFTDWRAPRLTQLWIKQRVGAAEPAVSPPRFAAPEAAVSPPPRFAAPEAAVSQAPPFTAPDPAVSPPPRFAAPEAAVSQAPPFTAPDPAVARAPWFTAAPAPAARNPVPGAPPDACTEQLGVPGRWYDRLPHFRPEFQPSAGAELQSEFLLPVAHATGALHALAEIRDHLAPVLQICEIREVAADGLWLSPCYRQDSVAFHFTWIADPAAVLPVVTLVERQLAPFAPRPHWGKIFTTLPEDLHSRYQRLPDFLDLIRRLDPSGKFRNAYTERYLGSA
jgi:alditol oxidase